MASFLKGCHPFYRDGIPFTEMESLLQRWNPFYRDGILKLEITMKQPVVLFKTLLLLLFICNSMNGFSYGMIIKYDDGLPRSTPEEQGVPSKVIADFMQQVKAKGYDVHNLMMIRHGKVIFEHSWAPYTNYYQHAMYSATKTFTGLAVGFAVKEGFLNINDKVTSFFPDLLPDTISPQLAKLTVKHLLTMSVGHASTSYAGSGRSQIKSFLAAPFQPNRVPVLLTTSRHRTCFPIS